MLRNAQLHKVSNFDFRLVSHFRSLKVNVWKNFEVLLEIEENRMKNLVPKECVSSQWQMKKSDATKDEKVFK